MAPGISPPASTEYFQFTKCASLSKKPLVFVRDFLAEKPRNLGINSVSQLNNKTSLLTSRIWGIIVWGIKKRITSTLGLRCGLLRYKIRACHRESLVFTGQAPGQLTICGTSRTNSDNLLSRAKSCIQHSEVRLYLVPVLTGRSIWADCWRKSVGSHCWGTIFNPICAMSLEYTYPSQSTTKSASERQPHLLSSATLEMSLPILTTLSETTSLSATIYPFLHQLSLSHILPLLRREVNPTEWYLSTNPFISGLHFSLFFSVVALVASEINRNYSQVDRLWSILPAFYIAHFTTFAHMKGLQTERLDTLMMFGCLWSVSCPPLETRECK